jgi:predicted dehydrogenase
VLDLSAPADVAQGFVLTRSSVRRLRAAVVGLGHWGPVVLANLRVSADFEVVATCDRDPSRGADYLEAGGMLEASAPEVVFVAVPVAAHRDVALEAIARGAHVFCEKPLAASAADAEDVIAAARRAGRRIFVNQMCAGTAAVHRIRALHDDGSLGTLVHVEAQRENLGRVQHDVDVVWDLAPHDLAILRYVLGRRVTSVEATGRREESVVRLAFEGGTTASLSFSWVAQAKVRRMTFVGTHSEVVNEEHEPDALARELAQVARALRGLRAHVATEDAALETVRILEACRASLANDGARVLVS